MRIKPALVGALTASALLLTGATAASATAQADITRAKAIKIAKKAVPGGRVTDVEREYEHGYRTWKIELQKGRWEYDLYIAIKTGKVIKMKIDRD
ncbi:PepSY domain-containing protein [Acrocarpospora sp. B8E8]|uniref:PepSY domain-containing protein n=1 Tax=Acrocarpospora sp. B8E8 TaxID=3153572 RepID=UPI00325E6A2A